MFLEEYIFCSLIAICIEPLCKVPNIIFNKVDLPQPFLPKIPRISPVSTENETSLRTSFSPKLIEALCNLNIAKEETYKN